MQQKIIVPIQDSLGFSLRSIRAQSDYIEYLTKEQKLDVKAIVLAHPIFKSLAEETFSRKGAEINFLSQTEGNESLESDHIDKLAKKEHVPEKLIITELKAVRRLREVYSYYPTISDNLGQLHPYPNKPAIFVKENIVRDSINKLISVTENEKATSKNNNTKAIFIPFSGLKCFGTDYGQDASEKERIREMMSFPLEEVIPAIGEIQKNLRSRNIIAFPIIIQYGNLKAIHAKVTDISTYNKLSPMPASLGINWNHDLERQVGFFHALNQWSERVGLPNIAIAHGSSCLHMIEECAEQERMITFFATHTHMLKPEDDGRIYHLAISEKNPNFLRAIKPLKANSHDYRSVAKQIVQQVTHMFDFYKCQ